MRVSPGRNGQTFDSVMFKLLLYKVHVPIKTGFGNHLLKTLTAQRNINVAATGS